MISVGYHLTYGDANISDTPVTLCEPLYVFTHFDDHANRLVSGNELENEVTCRVFT